jgi:hypothetical protein
MTPFDLNNNLQKFSRTYSQCVLAMVRLLIWSIIALASLAAAHICILIIWEAIQIMKNALNI